VTSDAIILADAGAIRYEKQPLEITDLVRATLRAFAARLADARLALDASGVATDPIAVDADVRRLTQVLNNLLENTLRCTDAGGCMRVGVKRVDRDAVLRIEDSAPGVPAELLPRLFERLFRAEPSRNRRHGGAGLGLSLCRSIVEAHGGRIEAHASDLGGVRIDVRLPTPD